MIYDSKWFIFLAIFLFIFILWFIFRKYKSVNLILPYKHWVGAISFVRYLLIFLIFSIVCIIPFNFGIYQWTEIKKVPTLNIEILFDVSLSMTAKDFKPDRFYVAKKSLVDFLDELDTNYNIWMITFSWHPFVYIPFTNDKKALTWKINHMTMADFPPIVSRFGFEFAWTAIWDALLLWTKQLLDYSKKKIKPWVIILFTDGDSNKGINPLKALEKLKQYNIPIFVWAIWAKDFLVWQDVYGSDVNTKISYDTLKKLAKESWWEFKQIKNKEDFKQILSKLYSYVKNFEQEKKINEYLYINYYLKWILLVLLFIYWILFVRFHLK